MALSDEITAHYIQTDLVAAIERGIVSSGKTVDSITIDDLAPVDEFHIGGRAASIEFLDQLDIDEQTEVLDVGCGIGGASRFVAQHYGAPVSGIDLTPDYVAAGAVLCDWVGLGDRVSLHVGSALNTPFEKGRFDRAFMMHVGMNIADKAALFTEVARVLKPGGRFGVYDVMKTGDGELEFPVPWAASARTSALASPKNYQEALRDAGFVVESERNRHEFALEFFEQLRAKVSASGGPPPLGLHILMGPQAPLKVQHMIANIAAGKISPVELVARKP